MPEPTDEQVAARLRRLVLVAVHMRGPLDSVDIYHLRSLEPYTYDQVLGAVRELEGDHRVFHVGRRWHLTLSGLAELEQPFPMADDPP